MTAISRTHQGTALRYAALGFLMVFLLFPLFWMGVASLKGSNPYSDPYSIIPRAPDFSPYARWLWGEDGRFWRALRNTSLAFVATTLITLPLGAMAGYALAKWRSRWAAITLFTLFVLQMMPTFITVGPQFLLFIKLGLVGNVLGLYAVYAAICLPIVTLMMRSYFLSLPREVEEAARVDGCNRWQVFTQIALPMARPGLATSTLFVFVMVWLEYILANQLMRGKYDTLAIILVSYSDSDQNYRPDLLLSLSLLIMLPLAVLFPFLRRHLQGGLGSGAVKG